MVANIQITTKIAGNASDCDGGTANDMYRVITTKLILVDSERSFGGTAFCKFQNYLAPFFSSKCPPVSDGKENPRILY